jgi:hypothetical protein
MDLKGFFVQDPIRRKRGFEDYLPMVPVPPVEETGR